MYKKLFEKYNIQILKDLKNILEQFPNIFDDEISSQHLEIICNKLKIDLQQEGEGEIPGQEN